MAEIEPKYLQAGDTVLLIGISRARSQEQLAPAITQLQAWGLQVECGPNLYKKHHQFAGNDAERAADLQWAINHLTAKAVVFAGGGYGAMRVIDSVDFAPVIKAPKWFIGYSDTTVVFSRLEKIGVPSLHATMAFQFSQHEEATESLRKALFGDSIDYAIVPSTLNRNGTAEGKVVGGNLSLLYALSGSCDDLETSGCILFIEDLDEQLYHLDRMMLQLKRSCKLSGLKALLVGGMSDMKDNAIPYGKTAEEIILDAVKEHAYPVCFNFPAGHIPRNLALYLGKKARLEVDAFTCKLNYL
jgi:muramoyltetrapeptide carboxypeptidase